MEEMARPDDLYGAKTGIFQTLRTAMLRKNVTAAISKVGLGLFVSPCVRLGTSAPICIPWQETGMAGRIVYRRPVTELRIARLSGFTICLARIPYGRLSKSEGDPDRL